MPYLTLVLFGSASGIALHVGVTHLLVGLARWPRDRTQLILALLALAIAAHTLVVLRMHTASSVAAYLRIHKYLFGPTTPASLLGFVWFVAAYTACELHRILVGLSLWIVGVMGLYLLLPFGILYTRVTGLRQVALSWGEQIVPTRGTPSPWRLSFDLCNLALCTFFFVALVCQYRCGSRRDAVILGLALGLFLVAQGIDTLAVVGMIDSPLTSSLVCVAIVITMSLQLSYAMSATERTLHHYQQHLQELVAVETDPAGSILTLDEIRLIETIAADTSVAITDTCLHQDAFNNSAKHAGATEVQVTYRVTSDTLVLAVGIGAQLSLSSAPHRGTEVVMRWPNRFHAAGLRR